MSGTGETAADGRWERRLRIPLWGGAAALLALPLVAMRFTEEVNWTGFDFVFAAIMFGGTGLLLELAMRASRSWAYRGGVAAALAANFLLIWVNGAVGLLGDEDNPANLLFFGVLAVALLGAVLARFNAAGMARAMRAAAAAQVAIGAAALAAGLGSPGIAGIYEAVLGTGFFAALWLLSAGLFRKGARGAAA
jgi:hypothetical protein